MLFSLLEKKAIFFGKFVYAKYYKTLNYHQGFSFVSYYDQHHIFSFLYALVLASFWFIHSIYR